MGLSDELRSELAAIAPERGCCRLAEVSALFHSAGSVHLRGRGRVALHLDVATSGVARRAFTLLRQLGIHSEIRTYSRRSFDRATRYQLHVSGDDAALASLVEAGVLDARHAPLERPPKRVVGRACCRGAYLRGALLGGGSLSGPRAPHLELRTTSLDGAEFLRSVAAADEVRLGVLDRGRHAVAYAKGFDAIESVLTRAGATDTVLAFEERSIVAAARGEANRLANADHANLVRTSRAAQEQLEAVRALQREGALERLPERLHEVARLRLRYPQLPLRELAAKCEPPSTKASVHRRLKKVQSASKLISGAKRPFRVLARTESYADSIDGVPEMKAGRRGSSEDDLPLRVPCSGADAERGLNSTTDEHGPALSRLRHRLSCVTPHSFSAKATIDAG